MSKTTAILMVLCLGVVSSAALADDYIWSGTNSNDWSDGGNWGVTATVPTSVDKAIFGATALPLVDISSTVADLDITAGNVNIGGPGPL
ncbi:hypothetical protein LCGC14_1842500, partial [marine sediment metagenome]